MKIGFIGALLGQIEIPLFRVTRPYLNLLVEPRTFFRFSGKIYNEMPFKMYKIIYFFLERKATKNVCAYLPKIPVPLPETHLFFIWP